MEREIGSGVSVDSADDIPGEEAGTSVGVLDEANDRRGAWRFVSQSGGRRGERDLEHPKGGGSCLAWERCREEKSPGHCPPIPGRL